MRITIFFSTLLCFVFVLGLESCKQQNAVDPNTNVIELVLPQGLFLVRDLHTDLKNHVVNFSLDKDHNVIIQPAIRQNLPIGISYNMTSQTGDLLFKMELGWDNESGISWAFEQTANDNLLIIRKVEAEMVTEKYIINGQERIITYPNLPPDAINKAIIYYKNGNLDTSKIRDERLAILYQAFTSFERFYSLHTNNTLHNNIDGVLLAEVASSEELARAIESNFGGPKRLKKLWEYTCSGAGICMFLKCSFFGPFNSLCDICIMITGLCIISPFIVP